MSEIARVNSQNQIEGGPLKVGVIGGTGTVGQRIIEKCIKSDWFEVTCIAASSSSEGKRYEDAVETKWNLEAPIFDEIKNIIVCNVQDIKKIASECDIVFSATKLSMPEVKELEESYAHAGLFVSSCSSAQRDNMLVPTVNPGVNDDHLKLITIQREKMGYTTGANIVKSNCAVVPGLAVISPFINNNDYIIEHVHFSVIQALSGVPTNRNIFPEIQNNLIPLDGERIKTENEPRKILGSVSDSGIETLTRDELLISAHNVRGDIKNGHTALVTATFIKAPNTNEVLEAWNNFGKSIQNNPTAPEDMIEYNPDIDRPQVVKDHIAGNGMSIVAGQLRIEDNILNCIATSDNTQIGAAGGAVLATEEAIRRGFVFKR